MSSERPPNRRMAMDDLALTYSRLAMATLSPQSFAVHADGALYDPVLYGLFRQFAAAAIGQAKEQAK